MIRLTAERVERGWSKAVLGRRASLDPSTLSKVEARKVVPYLSQLRRLAKVLGWSPQDAPALLEEVEVTPRPGTKDSRRSGKPFELAEPLGRRPGLGETRR